MNRKRSIRESRLRRIRRRSPTQNSTDEFRSGRYDVNTMPVHNCDDAHSRHDAFDCVSARVRWGCDSRPNAKFQVRHFPSGPAPKFDGVAGRIDCGSVSSLGIEAMFRTAPYATDIGALTLIGVWIGTLVLSRIVDASNFIAHVAILCWRWTRQRFLPTSRG